MYLLRKVVNTIIYYSVHVQFNFPTSQTLKAENARKNEGSPSPPPSPACFAITWQPPAGRSNRIQSKARSEEPPCAFAHSGMSAAAAGSRRCTAAMREAAGDLRADSEKSNRKKRAGDLCTTTTCCCCTKIKSNQINTRRSFRRSLVGFEHENRLCAGYFTPTKK